LASKKGLDSANLVLRFALELTALAALAYWALETHSGPWRWVLAIAAPGATALAWALVVSPKAVFDVPPLAALAVEFSLFVAAAFSLAVAGNLALGLALAVVEGVSGSLNHVFARSRSEPRRP